MTINHNTISSTVTLSNCLEPQSININHHNNYYNNDNYKNDNKSSTIAETNNSSTFFPSSELSINLDKVYKKATQSPVVLTTFELALKRTEKHSSSVTELRHKPYIPSQLGPNRLDDWLSTVAFFPSEKYNNNKSKKEQTKFNLSNKMIDSTAAYRAGEQLYGWINTESEEYLLKKSEDSKTEELSIISCGGDFLFFDPILPIKDSNLRIDENRPKLGRSSSSRGKTTINGKSPSAVLEGSRRCLTALLTVKRETKL